jgi:hypothetical protein
MPGSNHKYKTKVKLYEIEKHTTLPVSDTNWLEKMQGSHSQHFISSYGPNKLECFKLESLSTLA